MVVQPVMMVKFIVFPKYSVLLLSIHLQEVALFWTHSWTAAPVIPPASSQSLCAVRWGQLFLSIWPFQLDKSETEIFS